jgi:hypothetical protein
MTESTRPARQARRSAKNARNRSPLSVARTPPSTSGRWFSRLCRSRSPTDPPIPALSSQAPKTTRSSRPSTIAPAHIAHGSSVTYSVAPASRESPAAAIAARIARSSAWAVASPSATIPFRALASATPARTTMAPTGTSPAALAARASSRAARIHCSSCTVRMLDTVSVIPIAM